MTRIEIVRTDAPQPWHARIITNGRITWRTENYTRMVGAEKAVIALLRITGDPIRRLTWNVPGREKICTNNRGDTLSFAPTILYVDERRA